ncbi:MAG: transposase domain-containing protein [Phascolarctobacterium sp.]|nr:transposase domain-containing protein [Phascolarctobacterium sp.]
MSTSLQSLNENQSIQEWATRIKECRNSNMTVRGWCSEQGSAVIYSLVETAKENKLDPYRYLVYVLDTARKLD